VLGRELFSKLKSRKTIALITADHGELLGEHNLMSHGDYLYNELIHIPFIIWGADKRGIINEPVSLVDILPSLFYIAEIQIDEELALEGKNIFKSENPRYIYSECWSGNIARKALCFGDYKYVWTSAGDYSLYNITKDATEKMNLVKIETKTSQVFHEVLSSRFDLSKQGKVSEKVSDKTLKLLKSLGYVH
jgi:arylsulfatase A-like enzyme